MTEPHWGFFVSPNIFLSAFAMAGKSTSDNAAKHSAVVTDAEPK
jgi:hypothetical protein